MGNRKHMSSYDELTTVSGTVTIGMKNSFYQCCDLKGITPSEFISNSIAEFVFEVTEKAKRAVRDDDLDKPVETIVEETALAEEKAMLKATEKQKRYIQWLSKKTGHGMVNDEDMENLKIDEANVIIHNYLSEINNGKQTLFDV